MFPCLSSVCKRNCVCERVCMHACVVCVCVCVWCVCVGGWVDDVTKMADTSKSEPRSHLSD